VVVKTIVQTASVEGADEAVHAGGLAASLSGATKTLEAKKLPRRENATRVRHHIRDASGLETET